MNSIKRLAAVSALATAALLLLAGSAGAASPWWHLNSGARPTHIEAGAAKSEIQEVTATPEEVEPGVAGAVFGIAVAGQEVGFFASGPLSEVFGLPKPTAENVQEALEEKAYGAGDVVVSGGPAGAAPLLVESVNGDAGVPVSPMEIIPFIGAAHAKVLQEGRPDGQVILTVSNLGDQNADGEASPIEIADQLPAGLEAVSIEALAGKRGEYPPVECSLGAVTCAYSHILPIYTQIEVRIGVLVEEGAASGEENELSVTGGGAPPASKAQPIVIGPEPTPFGAEDYDLSLEEEGGAPATKAGSHPFQVTGTIFLNQSSGGHNPATGNVEAQPVALAKDLHFDLPPGLIGNPSPFKRCTLDQFSTESCPPASAIGVAIADINEPRVLGIFSVTVPLYNLEPAFGEPARFGFLPTQETPVILTTSLRDGPGEDYGVTVSSLNTLQTVAYLSSEVTFWGTPGDARHDNARSYGCLEATQREGSGGTPTRPCKSLEELHPPAFQTLPTQCSGAPLSTSVALNSWTERSFQAFPGEPMPILDSCNQLAFSPQLKSEPTTNAATSPTGLSFNLDVNDEGLENSKGKAQSQIKKVVATLPEGFTTNPSVAEGLHACPQAAYEEATVEVGSGCPNESKIGDVTIESPLVSQVIHGSLYVAKQHNNPYNNLLTIYLVARNAELGIVIRQALKVTPNLTTGQLTTEVDNIPQLPFSHFQLSFRQGQRSPLVSPSTCGTYAVAADLYPYSDPTAPLHRESAFQITQGPEGQPCPSGNTPPFHPYLEAGTLNNRAGSHSPFYVHMTRHDSEQEITHFSIKLPPGVSGKLAGVAKCSDAQIAVAKSREHEGGGDEELANPSCPASSEVGHSLVGSGVGNVLAYAPGKMYLAGPYHGSALSFVSITAAKVGPFDLGTVAVRFALRINPETGEVFVDATGSDPIPHIVDGFPVHLRDIRAYVDRPDFVLNPTSCEKTSTASTVLGAGLNFATEADDQPVTVTSPFQAADCANLGFKPNLALKLLGGTKRGDTPKLRATLTYPKGGAYANIARAQVTLPHSEFLDNAHIGTVCTRVQFNQGEVPGEKCPPASIYGYARAITPLLDDPVQGPVYLRSSEHQLPDLVAALHNGEINIALDGRIDSVNGQIRSTFEEVPDAPVSKFTLEMQGGKKGLLENSTNLCAQKHRAIANFTGQNGKVHNFNPVLQAKCLKAHKKHKRSR